jgi:osmotically-inducible protein OsmY
MLYGIQDSFIRREQIMSDDSHLKQTVLDELKWEPRIDATHIEVAAKAGIVTLTGHVDSYVEKSAAERAVRRVKDVKAIAEEIEVKLPDNVQHKDEEIASAAIERLAWDSAIPRDAIKTKVEKGWVTLTGQVDWHFQQAAAGDDVRGLWGVVGVSNAVTIKPKPNSSQIREDIRLALHRAWYDPATINVATQDGKVTLTGKVGSWYEREEAGSCAWAAPGTTSVHNDLAVSWP